MRNNAQAIHRRHIRPLAVWETETTADRLFNQSSRMGGTQRDDRVQVGYIPTLFKHVDVDDDLGGLVRMFDFEET